MDSQNPRVLKFVSLAVAYTCVISSRRKLFTKCLLKCTLVLNLVLLHVNRTTEGITASATWCYHHSARIWLLNHLCAAVGAAADPINKTTFTTIGSIGPIDWCSYSGNGCTRRTNVFLSVCLCVCVCVRVIVFRWVSMSVC